jgi:CBS domain-containing protein
MLVRDLMNRNVVCVDPNATLQDAAQRMLEQDVGTIFIANGDLIGLLTARDLALRSVSQGWNPSAHRVSEIMSPNPVCAPPDMDVLQASDLMATHKVRRLPVCQDGRIIGVITVAEIADYTRRCLDNLTEETMAEK